MSIIESSAIVKSIRTRCYPEQVWEAWMDLDHLAQWLVDKASGWPGVGSTLSLTWERLQFTLDYQVAEAKACERLVWKTRMPAGFQTLTVTLRREGASTVVELREVAPENAPDAADSASDSAWQMALAILKHYLENYQGLKRHSFFAIKAADFEDAQLLQRYCTAEGLGSWLADSVERFPGPDEEPTDKPFSLRIGEQKMSGKVLTRTRNEVALSWDEIQGFLELKCFSMGPGLQAVCLRGSGYNLGEKRALALEELLGERLGRLAQQLGRSEPPVSGS